MAMVVDLQRAEDPRDIVHRAVQALAEGHVVGLPTETVYGLAVSALDGRAVERLVELKGQGWPVHLVLAVRSADAALDYMCCAPLLARRLARRCWPGPVTLVVPCKGADSAVQQLPDPVRRLVVAPDGGVGFRVVAHRIVEQLHQFIAGPLVLTQVDGLQGSAVTTGQAMVAALGDRVPLLLDDGPTRYGGPSSVVRVSNGRMEILREGVVERAAMEQFAKPLIAIVCTGNTCRSPIAEVMLRERLRQATGSESAVGIVSAGLSALPGDQAAPQAIEVMGRRGLDLTDHASQLLDEQIMRMADLVLTMTRSHREGVLSRWPEAADRVHTLRQDGGDIADPVGAPLEVYEACADQIDRELGGWVDRVREELLGSEQASRGGTGPAK